ncbi:MAG: pyridoxamine 5'-phosphate oxidase family protein [Acetobacteraceae bacterium]|nr:pyridoxamine 5'-phosphate oxidase family protein [Acetobacteraceae bacterium]
MSEHTDAEKKQKLWSMMKDIGTAMLTTEDGGKLRARPMVAAQTEFDGELWFFTRVSSHKVDEVKNEHQVGVTYSDAGTQDYVSLSGRATLLTDKALVMQHWSESMRTWFPKGVDDPEAALLKVVVESAEYWDAPSSTMVHAYGYLKARLTGEPPHPGGNEKVSFT